MPGLLLTPHVGGSVPGGLGRAYAIAAQQIAVFARGERPANVVEGDY
jgi:phosphoglycerate dehydrogenase-like enzyme